MAAGDGERRNTEIFLVLCHASDLPALWAWRGLREAGLGTVELITAELLSSSLGWVHRIADGSASLEVKLADGRSLESRRVCGTLNRLHSIPLVTTHAAPADGPYAAQEWAAFTVSWLHSFPGVMLNRPHPSGLAGRQQSRAEWILAATRAGLPAVPYSSGQAEAEAPGAPRSAVPRRRVLVVGHQVLGAPIPPPVALVEPCLDLARQAGAGLLGLDFIVAGDGAWFFRGATSTPELQTAGPAAISAIAQALRNGP